MAGKINDEKLKCSFCNKPQDKVKKLIAGANGAYICDECVAICSEILDEEFLMDDDVAEEPQLDINLLKPKEIKELAYSIFKKYNSKSIFENDGNKITVSKSQSCKQSEDE